MGTLRLCVFSCLVALALAAALRLVSERAAIIRTGRRVAELEAERRALLERNHKLEAECARLKTAAHLIERVKALGIQLVPPEERLSKQARGRVVAANRRSR